MASIMVTCSRCGRLHRPGSLLATNPVCGICRPDTPAQDDGDSADEESD